MGNSISTNRQPFGLNIAVPKKTIAVYKKVAIQSVADMTVNPFINFFEEKGKVFNGEVAAEIRKYQARLYMMGQYAREGQPRTTFKADA